MHVDLLCEASEAFVAWEKEKHLDNWYRIDGRSFMQIPLKGIFRKKKKNKGSTLIWNDVN